MAVSCLSCEEQPHPSCKHVLQSRMVAGAWLAPARPWEAVGRFGGVWPLSRQIASRWLTHFFSQALRTRVC